MNGGTTMKRFIVSTLVTITLLTSQVYAHGVEIKPSIEVNGVKYECIIKDATTYMPIRAVFEALNFTVDWDANTKAITIYNDKMIHIISTTNNMVYHQSAETVKEEVEGDEEYVIPKYSDSSVLEHKIVFDNDRTYLPFRELLEAMGYTISWDPNTKTATVHGVGKEPSSYSLTKAEEFIDSKAADLATALGYDSVEDMVTKAKQKASSIIDKFRK